MSNENFEAMRAKAKECEDLVEKKEAIVMAELQQIYAKKNEVDRKVETNLNAIEETKAAIETTLWSAKMADSAKAAIEIELFRYHQQQQKLVPDGCLSRPPIPPKGARKLNIRLSMRPRRASSLATSSPRLWPSRVLSATVSGLTAPPLRPAAIDRKELETEKRKGFFQEE
ncbi:hypothetical protein Fmac_014429 [Flemingia macrophylla]|uniref:Uncharacterized protein n=1 Tax=Flemingia macrophylla TaxID=520843 RepID=A0ABD1MBQ9_9FABA